MGGGSWGTSILPPRVGERIKERLRALGYEREGQPDAARFMRELRYDGRYFYPWLKDRTPSGENLARLAVDLRCSRAWLLLGEGPAPDTPPAPPRRRTPVPIRAGSTALSPPAPRGAAAGVEGLCKVLRIWFPLRWGWLDGSPTWSPA